MKSIFLFLLSILCFSCIENKPNEESLKYEKLREIREIKNDSVSLALSNQYKIKVDLDTFHYRYLFELQEFLNSDNKRMLIKNFEVNEIYIKDSNYFCIVDLYLGNNLVFLDLSVSDSVLLLLKQVSGDESNTYHSQGIVALESVTLIDFEFGSAMQDYSSRIDVVRGKTLYCKGEVLVVVCI